MFSHMGNRVQPRICIPLSILPFFIMSFLTCEQDVNVCGIVSITGFRA